MSAVKRSTVGRGPQPRSARIALTACILLLVASAAPAADPTTAPATAPASQPATNGALRLNFRDAPLNAVLQYLSEAAGLIILETAQVTGRITVTSRQPLSTAEAVALLDTVLKEKGYTTLRSGRTLRIIAIADAARENIPVQTGNDPTKIEPSDRIITQVIPVRHVDAMRLRTDLADLLPETAKLAANQASNSLILTADMRTIRRIMEVIYALDQHMSAVTEVKVHALKAADAGDAARVITELFRSTTAQSSRGGQQRGSFFAFMRGGRGSRGGGDRGQSSQGQATRGQNVVASADSFTNTLLVSASSELMPLIDDIVEQLETNAAKTEIAQVRVFPLQYADASNTASLLMEIFKQDTQRSSGRRTASYGRGRTFTMGGRGGGDTSTPGSGSPRNTRIVASADTRTNTLVVSASGEVMKVIEEVVEKLESNHSAEEDIFFYPLKNAQAGTLVNVLNDIFSEDNASSRTVTALRNTGGGRGGATRGQTTSGAQSTAAAGDLMGQVYFVADEDTNSLLVRTASKHFDRVKAIIAQLDRPIRQVLIKVLIAEITLGDTLDIGAEFSVLNLKFHTGSVSLGTDFSIASQTGGLVIKGINADYTATLRALDKVGRLEVLSRPYILASDNQEASITVGQEVPFIRNTRTTETGQTINTIVYEDIGILLTVTPHVNPDGLVIMDIAPEISTTTGTTVPISETVNAAVFAKRSAKTRVAIRNGQTIVIGGLMENRTVETIHKVPFLGDIPGLGALFRRTETTKEKTELLIFLTPHVADEPRDLKRISDAEQEQNTTVRDATGGGAFEKQMRAMNAPPTTQPAEEPDPPAATQPSGELDD